MQDRQQAAGSRGASTPGRNDPCPCGSGRKYKHCCGATGRLASAAGRSSEAAAYVALLNTKRITEADRALVDRISDLLKKGALTERDSAALHFALGKAQDDLGEHEAAIRHFDEGNRIRRRGLHFDRAQFAVGVDRLIASFDAEFFARNAALGSDDETPILIVGMMRAGAALVERIISAHPRVGAGGALPFWYDNAAAFAQAGPDGVTQAFTGRVAEAYRALLRRIGPDARRVTDRMPANFLWVGLIQLIFPKARFVHCRRHPVDTCLSNYFTDFESRQDHAYDRGDLAFYYTHYARLMVHWRTILPADRLLEIDYDDLVADPERRTRALIAFCGLDWNEACLHPENNRRVVITAEPWQARQPIYRTAVGRWRRYEPWLGELRSLLPDMGETAPARHRQAAKDHLLLAESLNAAGDTARAVEVLTDALRLYPDDPVVFNNLGLLHLIGHRLPAAIDCFEKAIALDPDLANAHYNLGAALERQRRYDEAIERHRRAIALDPALADAHSRLGNLLQARGQSLEAAECFQRASALSPESPRGLVEQAKILLLEEKQADAEQCLRRAIALDPANSEACAMLGGRLAESGRFDEGARFLKRAIELDPGRIPAYLDLVQTGKIDESGRPLVKQMIAQLEGGERNDFERTILHFALGKAFDDLGDYGQAIRHFDAGNRLEHDGLFFDRHAFAAGIDRLIAGFTPDFFKAHAAAGAQSETPLLILGMPRSGTTLVEQILSSHPEIGAGGEMTFWGDRGAALDGGAELSAVRRLADDYQSILRRIAPGAARVTDKTPFNFLWIGLIHLVFPKARIIHCRRNPVDTCLSIYFTRFASRQDFAYDRGDLVFYYREYARLMAHWRSVLPQENLLEIDYEALIANRDGAARRMIAFSGLDWDDACLRHEGNRRLIKTASLWQARQPIYKSSVDRWRRYEPWLGELRQLLPDEAL